MFKNCITQLLSHCKHDVISTKYVNLNLKYYMPNFAMKKIEFDALKLSVDIIIFFYFKENVTTADKIRLKKREKIISVYK